MSIEDLLPSPQKRRNTMSSGRKQIAIIITSPENTENVNVKVEQEKKAELSGVTSVLRTVSVRR
jgi:hypothetical protein